MKELTKGKALFILHVMIGMLFSHLMQSEIIIYGLVRKCVKTLTFLLDNIYIRFGAKLYRQIVGIPMGTNCAPLVADLFLFCYERDFMFYQDEKKQAISACLRRSDDDSPRQDIRKDPSWNQQWHLSISCWRA